MKKAGIKKNQQTTSGKTLRSKNKKEDFFDRVFKVVALIPYGKVTTYGAIAEYCGIKSSARTVGWALNSAAGSPLPCHRVVNRLGELTGKIHFGSPDLMEDLLRSEGIEFDKNGRVEMDKYFWRPSGKTNNTLSIKKKRRC